MNSRFVLPLVLSFALVSAHGNEEPSPEIKKPSLTTRILKPWTFFRGGAEQKKAGSQWKQLTLTTSLEPLPVKLSESRQLKVTLQLANKGKRLVQLEFPTTQRIEVLLRNSAGKMIEQWSEDQSFTNEPTLVAVNPGERLEYAVSVSTRDLSPGEKYSVEAFFPNYEQLKSTTLIVPEK